MKIWTKVCGLICFVFPWRADSSLAQCGQWVLLKGFQCVLAGHPCYSEKREALGPHWAFTDAFPWIRTSHYFSAFFHIFFSSWRKKKKNEKQNKLYSATSRILPWPTLLSLEGFSNLPVTLARLSQNGQRSCGLRDAVWGSGALLLRATVLCRGGVREVTQFFRLQSCLPPPPPSHPHLTPVLSSEFRTSYPPKSTPQTNIQPLAPSNRGP